MNHWTLESGEWTVYMASSTATVKEGTYSPSSHFKRDVPIDFGKRLIKPNEKKCKFLLRKVYLEVLLQKSLCCLTHQCVYKNFTSEISNCWISLSRIVIWIWLFMSRISFWLEMSPVRAEKVFLFFFFYKHIH